MASFHRNSFLLLYFDFSMISRHGWLQPLIGITDYIGITLLGYHILNFIDMIINYSI